LAGNRRRRRRKREREILPDISEELTASSIDRFMFTDYKLLKSRKPSDSAPRPSIYRARPRHGPLLPTVLSLHTL
jgi:hypothetical protein